MSERELDEILNEVRKRSKANTPVESSNMSDNINEKKAGKEPSSANQRVSDFDIILGETSHIENTNRDEYFDLLSVVNNNRGDDIKPEYIKSNERPKKKSKKGIIIAIAVILVIAIAAVGAFFALSGGKDNEIKETPKTIASDDTVVEDKNINPLTGENGYNPSAIGKRPVAVVVENEYSTEAVRPQWGISDADIVLEGESEFSTRLLLFWADYTAVPDMVGPARSARPPFIRFSQLFDSVFIHAGLSKTKGAYIGADTVFQDENVDHINLLNCAEDGVYFGRNNERYTATEHTGYLNGKNLPELIENNNIDTALDSTDFSAFTFSKDAQKVGEIAASSCEFRFSSVACPKKAVFSYDDASHKYVTKDFDSQYGESNVMFENLIFLFDETEYIVKENYKDGQSETYCDYKLSGGSATILSEGTAVEASWGVDNGKLWIKSFDGKEISLNKGKSYIGYGSSNNGGKLELNPLENQPE